MVRANLLFCQGPSKFGEITDICDVNNFSGASDEKNEKDVPAPMVEKENLPVNTTPEQYYYVPSPPRRVRRYNSQTLSLLSILLYVIAIAAEREMSPSSPLLVLILLVGGIVLGHIARDRTKCISGTGRGFGTFVLFIGYSLIVLLFSPVGHFASRLFAMLVWEFFGVIL